MESKIPVRLQQVHKGGCKRKRESSCLFFANLRTPVQVAGVSTQQVTHMEMRRAANRAASYGTQPAMPILGTKPHRKPRPTESPNREAEGVNRRRPGLDIQRDEGHSLIRSPSPPAAAKVGAAKRRNWVSVVPNQFMPRITARELSSPSASNSHLGSQQLLHGKVKMILSCYCLQICRR